MATARDTSNGPDWKDLAEMIAAFEEQNTVFIEIYVRRSGTQANADLKVTAHAWARGEERRAAKPLASQSVICRVAGYKRMESAISYLLYQLDFLLAEHEWLKTESTQSVPPAQNENTDV